MSDPHSATNRLAPLAEDTLGPYYPHPFVDGDRSDLTRLHAGLSVRPKGTPIVLRGRLLDSEGAPVEDALIEFWQANAAGLWRTPDIRDDDRLDPCFDGYGRLITTRDGFTFTTIKPGPIAATAHEGGRAPHLTITIFSDGISRLVTQIFFDDEAPANARDPLLASLPAAERERLVARTVRSEPGASPVYEIAIVLRGSGETPFFDDLSS